MRKVVLNDIALHQDVLVITAKISLAISRWSNFEQRVLARKDPSLLDEIAKFEVHLIDLYSSILAIEVMVVAYCDSALLSKLSLLTSNYTELIENPYPGSLTVLNCYNEA